MTASDSFSSNYVEARDKFVAAASRRGLVMETFHNNNAVGKQGEALTTDVAYLGSPEAKSLLVLSSGTHGVEGYCGSGVQVELLKSDRLDNLPEDLAILFIHAMNPYGFSHDRRVNEDNIDLNRNFLDFSGPRPDNSKYDEIQSMILPEDWEGPGRQVAEEAIAAYVEKHGMSSYQAAASGGQYSQPQGIFYGGDAASWSRNTALEILGKYGKHASRLGFIDVHTGLGPNGYGELIALGSADQFARARAWYGDDVTNPDDGSSSSAPVVGTYGHGVMEAFPNAETTFIALEYGTEPIPEVIDSLRADNWLYLKGDVDSPMGQQIKQRVRNAFYSDNDQWKQKIWQRGEEVVGMAITALSTGN